jgi:hypothetical protein
MRLSLKEMKELLEGWFVCHSHKDKKGRVHTLQKNYQGHDNAEFYHTVDDEFTYLGRDYKKAETEYFSRVKKSK